MINFGYAAWRPGDGNAATLSPRHLYRLYSSERALLKAYST